MGHDAVVGVVVDYVVASTLKTVLGVLAVNFPAVCWCQYFCAGVLFQVVVQIAQFALSLIFEGNALVYLVGEQTPVVPHEQDTLEVAGLTSVLHVVRVRIAEIQLRLLETLSLVEIVSLLALLTPLVQVVYVAIDYRSLSAFLLLLDVHPFIHTPQTHMCGCFIRRGFVDEAIRD